MREHVGSAVAQRRFHVRVANLAQEALPLVLLSRRIGAALNLRLLASVGACANAGVETSHLSLELIGDQEPGDVPCVLINSHLADDGNLAILASGEQSAHAVVVALGDRVELMVVAARAADR